MSALGLTTRYSLERRTCGCTMHVSATGRFVLAADYDALITRLRAAEARTAWQPIETAPLWPDRSPTPLWIVGQRVARPPVTVAQTAPGVYVDEYSNRQHVTAWAPLPAAPEAP